MRLLASNEVRVVREDNGWLYGKTNVGNEVNISCLHLRHRMKLSAGDVLVGLFWGGEENQLEGRFAPNPSKDLYFLAQDRVEEAQK